MANRTFLEQKTRVENVRLKLIMAGLDKEADFLTKIWNQYVTLRMHVNSKHLEIG